MNNTGYKSPSNKFLFTFKKEDGKWKSFINEEFVFDYFVRLGIPLEITKDWVNGLSKDKILNLKINSWKEFSKINKINE